MVILFIFVYKVEGFIILLEKALGTVLQKLCSLMIEAACLIFKIISALEIYVVLLIDALTGKATANGKIASLAIGVLSIASFYTTYTGMSVLVERQTIAFLITLGIQAILLSSSLLINDALNLTKQGNHAWDSRILILLIICGCGCITAYVFPVFNLSYRTERIVYHILYMIVIVSAILAIFMLIKHLINTASINRNTSIFLFIIYFAVLSVSTFFSYNSFVPVMYPDSVRNIDAFQEYKLGIIALVERVNDDVDDTYYENVMKSLNLELAALKTGLEESNPSIFLSSSELDIYNYKKELENYTKLEEELTNKELELMQKDKQFEVTKNELIQNSGGIGAYTSKQLDAERKEYESDKLYIESQIKNLKEEIEAIPDNIKVNKDEYVKIIDKINTINDTLDCSKEIDLIQILLKQEEWSTADEDDLKEAINKIEQAKLMLSKDNSLTGLGDGLEDKIKVYCSYKSYKEKYADIFKQILDTTVDQDLYIQAYDQIQDVTYELLKTIAITKLLRQRI